MTGSLVLLATQARALDELLPCRRQDARLWFSDLPAELRLAKAYCQPCPVRRVCLAGAVERHEPHGVWGGEIFARGAIIADKRPPGRPPKMERRAKPELPARRSSLADHAGLRKATISVTAGAPERRIFTIGARVLQRRIRTQTFPFCTCKHSVESLVAVMVASAIGSAARSADIGRVSSCPRSLSSSPCRRTPLLAPARTVPGLG